MTAEYQLEELPDDLMAHIVASSGSFNEEQLSNKLVTVEASFQEAQRSVGRFVERGFLETHAEAWAYAMRMFSFGQDDRVSQRNRYAALWSKDRTREFLAYLESKDQRWGGESQSTGEVRGRTGSGKSALGLALLIALGLKVEHLERAVQFHKRAWLLAVKQAVKILYLGDPDAVPVGVLNDEDDEGIGEGSASDEKLVRMQEGKLRQAGIHFLHCLPNDEMAPMTRDFTIIAVRPHPVTHELLGLVYIEDQPYGYIILPPVPEAYWKRYRDLKKDNVLAVGEQRDRSYPYYRSIVLEVLTDRNAMMRMRNARYEAADVEDEVIGFVGLVAVNIRNRMVDQVSDVAPLWRPDEPAPKFMEAVTRLIERGVEYLPPRRSFEDVGLVGIFEDG